ncbi:MAG: TetR/AcrR family transcriptional regulator [Myxococcales bacterium]|nr:TetR/AcrR family transcriptional regulator [Myxococcales bacterium]
MARSKRRVAKPAAKKRIVRLDNEERRAALLAMGQAAFAKTPYDEVSIDDLAAKAKISKGLFYYYFPTKRDLYIAGLRETSKGLTRMLTSVPRDLPPRERAGAAVDAYLDSVQQLGPAFIALMRGAIGADPRVSEVVEAVRRGIADEFFASPVGRLLEQKPLSRVAIRGWIGMVEAASIEWLANRTIDRAAVRELLVDQLFAVLTQVVGSAGVAKLDADRRGSAAARR